MTMPYLIVVTGRPGAGKTTFSKELSKDLYLPVISRDEIKEGYVHTFEKPDSELGSDTNKAVFDIFFNTVTSLLTDNVSIIAEAAFQHKLWAPRLELLKNKSKMFLLICNVEDKIALNRFINRGLNNPAREYFHGDKGVDLARKGIELSISPYDEPRLDVPTFHIDTTGDYKPSIDELRINIFGMNY